MSYFLTKYKKKDFKRVSWAEYDKTLEVLWKNVRKYLEENRIKKIDAVVPILRGGAFPGTYLAFQLRLLRILPIQYHYSFEGKKIVLKKILDVPTKGHRLPKRPALLLVENNHCFGVTAATAAKDLKKAFPGCRIIYAADHVDYSYRKIDNVEVVLYGKLTNETRKLSREEAKRKGVSNALHLFPWESLEEEWTTVQGKQFAYRDIPVLRVAKKKAEFPGA